MHCIVLNVRSRSFAKQKLQPVGTLGESSDRRDMEQIIERIELRSMLLGFPKETLLLEISFGNSWISLRETSYRDFAMQNSFAERFHFVKLFTSRW